MATRLAGEAAIAVQGPPGCGKTHLLLEVGRRLETAEGLLTVRVDLAETRLSPAMAVAEALAAAARLRGLTLDVHPADEWLAWLDRGPGALCREAIEAACRATHGRDIADVRRTLGAGPLAALLAEVAHELWLPDPDVWPPRERLARLHDQLSAVWPEVRVVVLLDSADAVEPAALAPLLSAVAEELPSLYGQRWSTLFAAAAAPARRPGIEVIELPAFERAAVAAAHGAPPELLATDAAWELLAGLFGGRPEPLAEAADLLAEHAAGPRTRPVGVAELVEGQPLRHLLAVEAPQAAKALGHGRAEVEAAGWLMLTRAIAGLPPAMPLGELAGLLEMPPEPLGRLLAEVPGWTVNEVVRWAPPDAAELEFAAARRRRGAVVSAAERAAERAAWLRGLAESAAETVVWENVAYAGECLFRERFEPDLAGPLPSGCGWRLVLLAAPLAVPSTPEPDPRTLVMVPHGVEAERPAALEAAAVRAVAAEHADAAVRQLASTWLEARADAQADLAAAAYLSGDLFGSPSAPLDWVESLTAKSPATWPAALFRPRFAALHRRRSDWLEASLLEAPPAESELAAVWRELATAPRAAGSPLRRALGLAAASEPRGYTELRRWLDEQGGALELPPLFERLCAPPHGLTPPLAKLLVLAFVLRGEPATALEVAGRPTFSERLEAQRLAGCAWDELPIGQLRRLCRADRRSWAELLPFVRVLEPDLPALTSPAAVAAGRLRLVGALAQLEATRRTAETALSRLAQALGQPLPRPVTADLQRLAEVAAATSAEAFDSALEAQFGGDCERWASAVGTLRQWSEAAALAEPLAELATFVAQVALPAHHPLEADRLALRGQLDLIRLMGAPNLARGLLAQGDHFRRHYQSAYAAAHREHNAALAELLAEYDQAAEMYAALARLNSIAALGEPDAPGLGPALEALELQLRPCFAEPTVTVQTVCTACGWRLGDAPPLEAVATLREELALAFDGRARRLAALLTDEIIQQHGADRLEALHQVLLLQQTARLPSVLTPETIDLLGRCLPSAERPAVPLEVLRREFGTVTEEDLPALLARLEALVREALADSPDGHIRLS